MKMVLAAVLLVLFIVCGCATAPPDVEMDDEKE